jgi:hypothetical protein
VSDAKPFVRHRFTDVRERTMIDLDAPILPGRGAAGLMLGDQIESVLAECPDVFDAEEIVNPYTPVNTTRYRSPSVSLLEENGQVVQIMIHGNYRGKLDCQIGLGSTIADIQNLCGQCAEDDEDNLTIEGLSGLCFDVTGSFPNKANPFNPTNPMFLHATIDWICVYEEDQTVGG